MWEAVPNFKIIYLHFTVKPSIVTSTGLSHFDLPLFSVGVLSFPSLRVHARTTLHVELNVDSLTIPISLIDYSGNNMT